MCAGARVCARACARVRSGGFGGGVEALGVADDASGARVDDVLADGADEVGDSFEFAGGAEGEEGGAVGDAAAGFGVLDLLEGASGEGVECGVFGDEFLRGVGVDGLECAEGVVASGDDAVGHVEEGGGPGGVFVGVEVEDGFAEAHGVVGDAFDVGVGLDDEHQASQVAGDGLVEGDESDGFLFDVDFLLVDFGVACAEGLGGGAVALFEGGDCGFEEFEREHSFAAESLVECVERVVELGLEAGDGRGGARVGGLFIGHCAWGISSGRVYRRRWWAAR